MVRGTPTTNLWGKIMAVESVTKDIQVTVAKDLSTVTIGGVKVEVGPDSNVVVYTNDGVQTKPASGEAAAKGTQISISADFNTVVLNGATIERAADGRLVISTPGIVITKPEPANDVVEKLPDLAAGRLAQKVLEVGDRLKDGTVCIAVDLNKNKALFAPAGIFGGIAKFGDQHEIPAQLNQQNANGHNDWRNITDDEGKTLSEVWDKVAPIELKGRAAPWFWLASSNLFSSGRVRRGGEADWYGLHRHHSLPVPVVRSGPARS
jgi:hypothetical protein